VKITQNILYILQQYNGIGVDKKWGSPYHPAVCSYYPINYYISYYMFVSRHTSYFRALHVGRWDSRILYPLFFNLSTRLW